MFGTPDEVARKDGILRGYCESFGRTSLPSSALVREVKPLVEGSAPALDPPT